MGGWLSANHTLHHSNRQGCRVVSVHTCTRDVVEGVARDINKAKFLLHIFRHVCRETSELVSDVFFEGGATPAPHFFDLGIGVARKGQGVSSPTP